MVVSKFDEEQIRARIEEYKIHGNGPDDYEEYLTGESRNMYCVLCGSLHHIPNYVRLTQEDVGGYRHKQQTKMYEHREILSVNDANTGRWFDKCYNCLECSLELTKNEEDMQDFDSNQRLLNYAKTGLLPEDFEIYTFKERRARECIFCGMVPSGGSANSRLVYAPNGQGDIIRGPVRICISCSTENNRLVSQGIEQNEVIEVRSELDDSTFYVTLEDYHENNYIKGSSNYEGFVSMRQAKAVWGTHRYRNCVCEHCGADFKSDLLSAIHLKKTKDKHNLDITVYAPRDVTHCLEHRHLMKPRPINEFVNEGAFLDPSEEEFVAEITCELDDACYFTIKEKMCDCIPLNGKRYLVNLYIKLGFLDRIPLHERQDFIDILQNDIEGHKFKDISSNPTVPCPKDSHYCWCFDSQYDAAEALGKLFYSAVWSPEYAKKIEEILKNNHE